MWIFLWMSLVSVSPGPGGADRACPRKEPPPGVVVVPPGRELVLTCSGHVSVDGVKVNLTRKNPDASKRSSSLNVAPTSRKIPNGVSNESVKNPSEVTADGERLRVRRSDAAFTASPHTAFTTRANRAGSDWDVEETEVEADYEDEEGEEGSRVTRGLRSRPQWSWNRSAVGRGESDWGGISFRRSGALLNLSSVRLSDSGKYACYSRGRERFSVKVIVADPPESPSLFCYKKSPSSKIRCEWTPRRPVIKNPYCYLLLSKGVTVRPHFSRVPCSYSSQHSRCWCALDYNDDEQRTLHMAYLCVTGITGNATSSLLHFTPLDILKPDPPSNVSVRQEEGRQTRMKVSWNLPTSWKQQDSHYSLIYEIKYRPVTFSPEHSQNSTIKDSHSHTITDALPGVEYEIQVRAQDEYDGHWSEWSSPVYGRSWTAAVTEIDDFSTTVFDLSDLIEGSGSGADGELIVSVPKPSAAPQFALWIAGLFALLSVILTAFIFRHKDRFLSKLSNLSAVTQFGEVPPPPPAVTVTPEGQALVTFDPPLYKEEEVEEEEDAPQRMEAMHFSNTSYFFLQKE
ncbi:interleukin-6 receptor subunit alpha [Salarias fasciatus]|uniref:Interleukin-6 receptor subunit alpha-like n=1 Tax=Salarias fasciatus TaxID=181472 RepID=A0A672J617_SALFA|nr:interleukin-6 receptor subunit alpha-like [Salarias fasciatus]